MKLYALTIIYDNDKKLNYKFTNVVARTEEEAINKMKKYVAERGWFGGQTPDEVIKHLTAIDVVEIEISKE